MMGCPIISNGVGDQKFVTCLMVVMVKVMVVVMVMKVMVLVMVIGDEGGG